MRSETTTDQTRRRLGPWATMAMMLGVLVVGALLNAETLSKTAAAEPPGWGRSVAVFATDVMVEVGDALALDEPHDVLTAIRTGDSRGVDEPQPVIGEIFVPTPDRPVRLLAIGDSLIESIGAAVVNAVTDLGVVEGRFDVSYSSGLARPELFDWPAELGATLDAAPADIVVFVVGANDGQAIRTGSGFEPFGTPAWRDEYRARVSRVMDVLAGRAATTYWLGLPVAADQRLSERFASMNEIFEAEAASRSSVHFIDLYSEYAAADGAYAAHLPNAAGELVRFRDPDGVHFTPEGAEGVAGLVLRVVAETWELPGP